MGGCCCCFSLRSGTEIIGYFQCVSAFWLLVKFTIELIILMTDFVAHSRTAWEYIKEFYITLICELVVFTITMVVGVLLVIGVKRNKPKLLTLWLVVETLGLISLLVLFFDWMYYKHAYLSDCPSSTFTTFCTCITIGVGIYCFLIVFGLRKKMKRESLERIAVAVSRLDDHLEK